MFVSHNLQAVATLCDRALFLQHEIKALGPTNDVISQYVEACGGETVSSPDTEVRISSAVLLQNDKPVQIVEPGSRLTLRVSYLPHDTFPDVTFGFLLHRSSDQLVVYDGHFEPGEVGQPVLRKDEAFTVDFQFQANLTRGHYHLECHVYNNLTQRFVARVVPIANLTVHETRTYNGVADLAVEPVLYHARQTQHALTDAKRVG